jgi:hypothetical protein
MSDYLQSIDYSSLIWNGLKTIFAGILIAISAYYGVRLTLSNLSNRINQVETKVDNNNMINTLQIRALREEAEEQNERLHNLNVRVQEQINQDRELMDRLDNRYVRIPLLNAHKNNVSMQLSEIKHSLQSLLKFQLENKR